MNTTIPSKISDKVKWTKDTPFSLESGDGHFYIITGSKKPINHCILFIGTKRHRNVFENIDNAKDYAQKTFDRENSLKELNA